MEAADALRFQQRQLLLLQGASFRRELFDFAEALEGGRDAHAFFLRRHAARLTVPAQLRSARLGERARRAAYVSGVRVPYLEN